MTLTSVSEEDAAAFRMYGNSKKRGGMQESKAVASSLPVSVLNEKNTRPKSTYGEGAGRATRLFAEENDFGGGIYYYDRHGNVRLSDWDGFDNVVLAVTIFATTESTIGGSARNRPTSGEVIVIELLSTKNPPPLPSQQPTVAATFTQSNKSSPNIKLSSSSSSSITNQSPPPAPPAKGGSTSSEEVDSTSNSCASNPTQHQSQQAHLENEHYESPSNHTRILARRVLRWPGSVVSSQTKCSNNSCPSFVSLGRTTIHKEGNLDARGSSSSVRKSKRKGKKQQQQAPPTVQVKPKTGKSRRRSAFVADEGDDSNDTEWDCEKDNEMGEESQSPIRDELAADALDAVRSLNFLFGGDSPATLSSARRTTKDKALLKGGKKESTDSVDADGNDGGKGTKKTQPLSLCFVTNRGQVHFFHAFRVLLSQQSSKNVAETVFPGFSNSFASFLLGPELFTIVCEDVVPLSEPSASLQLSQLPYGVANDTNKEELISVSDTEGDPVVWKRMLSRSQQHSEFGSINAVDSDKQEIATNNDWSRLTQFDASIDPSSLIFRTLPRSNVITATCITSDTSNAYLAICGKGLRRIVHRNRRQIEYVLGGFVTFVSMRHSTEARTICLPFAPESIHPVYSQGVHSVILLGEEGPISVSAMRGASIVERWDEDFSRIEPTYQGRSPFAMSVRVDSSRGVDVSAENDITGGFVQHPRRFQPVGINLPSASVSLGVFFRLFSQDISRRLDSIQSKALAVSSIPSSPPSIIVAFQGKSDSSHIVVVVNLSLCPFKGSSMSTLVHHGHRVLLDVGYGNEQPAVRDTKSMWCTGGQVSHLMLLCLLSFSCSTH
jgi:hypothetical protein